MGSIADRLGVDLGACVGVRRLPCSPYGSVYGLSDDDDDDDDDDRMMVAAITKDVFFQSQPIMRMSMYTNVVSHVRHGSSYLC